MEEQLENSQAQKLELLMSHLLSASSELRIQSEEEISQLKKNSFLFCKMLLKVLSQTKDQQISTQCLIMIKQIEINQDMINNIGNIYLAISSCLANDKFSFNQILNVQDFYLEFLKKCFSQEERDLLENQVFHIFTQQIPSVENLLNLALFLHASFSHIDYVTSFSQCEFLLRKLDQFMQMSIYNFTQAFESDDLNYNQHQFSLMINLINIFILIFLKVIKIVQKTSYLLDNKYAIELINKNIKETFSPLLILSSSSICQENSLKCYNYDRKQLETNHTWIGVKNNIIKMINQFEKLQQKQQEKQKEDKNDLYSVSILQYFLQVLPITFYYQYKDISIVQIFQRNIIRLFILKSSDINLYQFFNENINQIINKIIEPVLQITEDQIQQVKEDSDIYINEFICSLDQKKAKSNFVLAIDLLQVLLKNLDNFFYPFLETIVEQILHQENYQKNVKKQISYLRMLYVFRKEVPLSPKCSHYLLLQTQTILLNIQHYQDVFIAEFMLVLNEIFSYIFYPQGKQNQQEIQSYQVQIVQWLFTFSTHKFISYFAFHCLQILNQIKLSLNQKTTIVLQPLFTIITQQLNKQQMVSSLFPSLKFFLDNYVQIITSDQTQNYFQSLSQGIANLIFLNIFSKDITVITQVATLYQFYYQLIKSVKNISQKEEVVFYQLYQWINLYIQNINQMNFQHFDLLVQIVKSITKSYTNKNFSVTNLFKLIIFQTQNQIDILSQQETFDFVKRSLVFLKMQNEQEDLALVLDLISLNLLKKENEDMSSYTKRTYQNLDLTQNLVENFSTVQNEQFQQVICQQLMKIYQQEFLTIQLCFSKLYIIYLVSINKNLALIINLIEQQMNMNLFSLNSVLQRVSHKQELEVITLLFLRFLNQNCSQQNLQSFYQVIAVLADLTEICLLQQQLIFLHEDNQLSWNFFIREILQNQYTVLVQKYSIDFMIKNKEIANSAYIKNLNSQIEDLHKEFKLMLKTKKRILDFDLNFKYKNQIYSEWKFLSNQLISNGVLLEENSQLDSYQQKIYKKITQEIREVKIQKNQIVFRHIISL